MNRSFKQFLTAFDRSEQGTVAVVFGLMGIAMFLIMGMAIDFSRWYHSKQVTKAAMDAAVLAGAKSLQNDSSDVDGALAVAQQFYQENTRKRLAVQNDTIAFKTANNNTSIAVEGNAYIPTLVLGLAGIKRLALLDNSGADYSQVELARGGNAGTNLEISLMLDITGSMQGDKIDDLKDAAKALIDIVVWDDQSEYTSRVALVPFSQAVNLGSTYFNAITNKNTVSTVVQAVGQIGNSSSVNTVQTGGGNGKGNKGKSNKGKGNGGDDNDNNSGGGSSQNYGPCAVDREGPDALTDEAPGPGSYIQVYDIAKQVNSHTKDMACRPGNITILPLTSDKDALNDKVDSFVADGWTAGSVGTAFAWYMLSPEWADIWPAESEPASYSDTGTTKIAILMTDGEYNTWYNGNGNGNASQQAVSLCRNMKAKGITVYTVGFDLGGNQTAINTLASCATDASHAYIADDGDSLRKAFREIATRMSPIYLSK
ncbi:MAG: VWA domain-containing protein [Hyphomicrobium sp.]